MEKEWTEEKKDVVNMKFVCRNCGQEYAFGERRWKCACGGYLNLVQQVRFTKADIDNAKPGLWRYEKAFALKVADIKITYGEGMTPLVPFLKKGGADLSFKLDSLMPTGSFKDRGSVMAVNYLHNFGADRVTEDSSGNSAASVAGYCALGGIKCDVYVPAGNSSGKLMQAAAFGASLHAIEGARDAVALAAQENEEYYVGHNWHPMFVEGYKSIAYELWEQSGCRAPHNIFLPCGGGGLTLGLCYGFKELLENGQVDRLPKIFAVQPAHCNPIYRLFHGIGDAFSPKPTIAEGTAIANPVKASEIAGYIKEFGGSMLSVSEEEIKNALKEVSAGGFYMEPTSAQAYAGYLKAVKKDLASPDEQSIVIVTGNGLKAGDMINSIIHE